MKTSNHVKVGTYTVKRSFWRDKQPELVQEWSVDVWVDGQRLANALGEKAAQNRRGTSKLQGGAVTVWARLKK